MFESLCTEYNNLLLLNMCLIMMLLLEEQCYISRIVLSRYDPKSILANHSFAWLEIMACWPY